MNFYSRILSIALASFTFLAQSKRPDYAHPDESFLLGIINKSPYTLRVQNTDVGAELGNFHRSNTVVRKTDAGIVEKAYGVESFTVAPEETIETKEFIIPWQDTRLAELKNYLIYEAIPFYNWGLKYKYLKLLINRKMMPWGIYGGDITIAAVDQAGNEINRVVIQHKNANNHNIIHLNATNAHRQNYNADHEAAANEQFFSVGTDFVLIAYADGYLELHPVSEN